MSSTNDATLEGFPAGIAPAAALGNPSTLRWRQQRWLIDNVIEANGIDWDQPRLPALVATCGVEALADAADIRHKVKKFADISPVFEAAALRREQLALTAEHAGERVSAREHFYIAANMWASAQWPLDDNNDRNVFLNMRKRQCFRKYARHADHVVEEVWIPFDGRFLPAWLHLPAGVPTGKLPLVVSIPGMDGFKERATSLYGDRWLNRGIAVLAIEGPGQYESALLGIKVSTQSWLKTGSAVMDWLVKRPEFDLQRVGVSATSFGSFAATLAVAGEPRFKACAVQAVAHEPGWKTVFEQASPTFKQRFMYMAGYTDEKEFDEFALSLDLFPYLDHIKIPYLCVAGELDELSPLEHTERLMRTLTSPRRLVVYGGARHAIGGASSARLGPAPYSMIANWMVQALAGNFSDVSRWNVDGTGRVSTVALV